LTEDLIDGGLYRFTPARWRDLSEGLLEVATGGRDGTITWRRVPDPAARRRPTRRQVPDSVELKRGEGIWYADGTVYVATTADSRVHAYDVRSGRIRVIYDGLSSPAAPLLRVDQLTVSPGGELFVCEDIATKEIDLGLLEGGGKASRFLSVTGAQHAGSELTGVAFDPSGRRMYFASQRARVTGAVYEVTGPFRGSA
jgi:secreted PhoX family phosphatase